MSALYVNGALARRLLVLHEGCRSDPYDDMTGQTVHLASGGNVTIGIGRNLSRAGGLAPDEINYLFNNDLSRVSGELGETWPWMTQLDQVRVLVLVDLCFNLGIERLSAFAPTLALIHAGEYRAAALRLTRTPWYTQTKSRGRRIVEMLATGELPSVLRHDPS